MAQLQQQFAVATTDIDAMRQDQSDLQTAMRQDQADMQTAMSNELTTIKSTVSNKIHTMKSAVTDELNSVRKNQEQADRNMHKLKDGIQNLQSTQAAQIDPAARDEKKRKILSEGLQSVKAQLTQHMRDECQKAGFTLTDDKLNKLAPIQNIGATTGTATGGNYIEQMKKEDLPTFDGGTDLWVFICTAETKLANLADSQVAQIMI